LTFCRVKRLKTTEKRIVCRSRKKVAEEKKIDREGKRENSVGAWAERNSGKGGEKKGKAGSTRYSGADNRNCCSPIKQGRLWHKKREHHSHQRQVKKGPIKEKGHRKRLNREREVLKKDDTSSLRRLPWCQKKWSARNETFCSGNLQGGSRKGVTS